MQEVFAQVWTQAGRYDASRGAVAAWMLVSGRAAVRSTGCARGGRVPRLPQTPGPPKTSWTCRRRRDLELLSAEQVKAGCSAR